MKTTLVATILGTALALAPAARADDGTRCARRLEKLEARAVEGAAPARYGDTGCADVEEFLIAHGYRREERMSAGLLGAGLGVFVGTYAMSAIPAAANGANANNPWTPMMIPIVGPFMMAGTAFSWASSDNYGFFDDLVGVFLVIDGLAQLGGVALAVAGAASTKTVFVRQQRAQVRVTPMVGRRSTGLSLSLAF